MSFLAKLTLDGEEYNVLNCAYSFSQNIDATGKPTALPRGGNISMLIESTGSTNVFDWMISPTQTKSGDIIFFKRDNKSKLKNLSFSDGHCIDYHEAFAHNGDNPMQITFTISAKKITLNDSVYEQNWPDEEE
jgi:Hemolysin coregulated protein Hcp (TssD)